MDSILFLWTRLCSSRACQIFNAGINPSIVLNWVWKSIIFPKHFLSFEHYFLPAFAMKKPFKKGELGIKWCSRVTVIIASLYLWHLCFLLNAIMKIMIQTGITWKKIPCYMCNSLLKIRKYFGVNAKYFLILQHVGIVESWFV